MRETQTRGVIQTVTSPSAVGLTHYQSNKIMEIRRPVTLRKWTACKKILLYTNKKIYYLYQYFFFYFFPCFDLESSFGFILHEICFHQTVYGPFLMGQRNAYKCTQNLWITALQCIERKTADAPPISAFNPSRSAVRQQLCIWYSISRRHFRKQASIWSWQ